MPNEIKNLAEMDTDDLFKELGIKKRFAEMSLMRGGQLNVNADAVGNFKFDADVLSLGIVADSVAKLKQIGKDFFKELSKGAFGVVCGTADGSDALKKVVGQGRDVIITALTALLVAHLAIAAAVAAIVAAIVVKLFFDAGGKVLCNEWKTSLPAAA